MRKRRNKDPFLKNFFFPILEKKKNLYDLKKSKVEKYQHHSQRTVTTATTFIIKSFFLIFLEIDAKFSVFPLIFATCYFVLREFRGFFPP